MANGEFITSITYGTNDARKVAYRFAEAEAAFKEVLSA